MARATTTIFQAAYMSRGTGDPVGELLLAKAVHTTPKLEKAAKSWACICL